MIGNQIAGEAVVAVEPFLFSRHAEYVIRLSSEGKPVKVLLEYGAIWEFALTAIVLTVCIAGIIDLYRSRPRV